MEHVQKTLRHLKMAMFFLPKLKKGSIFLTGFIFVLGRLFRQLCLVKQNISLYPRYFPRGSVNCCVQLGTIYKNLLSRMTSHSSESEVQFPLYFFVVYPANEKCSPEMLTYSRKKIVGLSTHLFAPVFSLHWKHDLLSTSGSSLQSPQRFVNPTY